eukprot:TRINITY_DN3269_c0_g1_i1.p1 TRINITY_DN3269_c0_g1~~TRINITY_DN3269_c0_g1_i1.p1  ORF type:complete len:366 (-),score=60.43 TRINITY_DN3269_c0_g1_i1:550-1602(-)
MEPLKKFPADVASEITNMMWAAAWHTSNIRKGHRGDAALDEIAFENSFEKLSSLCGGLGLSKVTLDNIKLISWRAAWHTANCRSGIDNDSKSDDEAVNLFLGELKASGEVSTELADKLAALARATAWHAANKKFNHGEDSKADKHRADNYAQKISAEVEIKTIELREVSLLALNNCKDHGMDIVLDNPSDSEVETSFRKKHKNFETISSSHSVSFKVGASSSMKTGFSFLAEGNVKLSMEASYDQIWGGSHAAEVTHDYDFKVRVGAGRCKQVQCLVREATVSVPYTATLDIAGVERKVTGTWIGRVYGQMRMVFNEKHLSAERMAVVLPSTDSGDVSDWVDIDSDKRQS